MSDTTDVTSEVPSTPDAAGNRRRRGGGLQGMLLGELQTMASSLGISGTAKMRKGDLIAAIEQNQAEGRVPRARAEAAERASLDGAGADQRSNVAARGDSPRTEVRAEVREAEADTATEQRAPRRASRAAGPPEPREDRAERDGDHAERGTEQPPRRPHRCTLGTRAPMRVTIS